MCDLLVFFIFAAKKGKSIYDNLYLDVVQEKNKVTLVQFIDFFL